MKVKKKIPVASVNEVDPYNAKQYKRLKSRSEQILRKGDFDKTKACYKWYAAQDWETLKEEWEKTDVWGNYQYPTLAEFISIHTVKGTQEDYWFWQVVGPRPYRAVPWLGYWAIERWKDHWKADLKTRRIGEVLTKEVSNLDILSGTKEIWFDELQRLSTLTTQLDEAYGGKLFHESLGVGPSGPSDANCNRAAKYISFTEKLLGLKVKALDGLRTSLGGDKAYVLNLMKETAKEAEQSGQTGVNKLLGRLLTVTLEKSEAYGLDLPPELEIELKNVTPNDRSKIQ